MWYKYPVYIKIGDILHIIANKFFNCWVAFFLKVTRIDLIKKYQPMPYFWLGTFKNHDKKHCRTIRKSSGFLLLLLKLLAKNSSKTVKLLGALKKHSSSVWSAMTWETLRTFFIVSSFADLPIKPYLRITELHLCSLPILNLYCIII